ncbi:MAG: ABC transporter permease [Nitrospinae bacterium]|nr:ABC transporter permease [Nitrospinota bacterium]
MNGWYAVYYREVLLLKRKLPKQLASMSVMPVLYAVAFGYGMGKGVAVDGHSYMEFLMPGLVAMASMNHSFAMAGEINISRFYWKIFEEFQAAPIRNIAYVAGEVAGGVTRGLLSALVILVISYLFGVPLSCGPWFWLAVALNAFVFASVAVFAAMTVRSHSDQSLLTSFLITPMAFLGGTVFPMDHLPGWAGSILSLLPLTHASSAIRAAAFGLGPEIKSLALMAIFGAVFFAMAFKTVDKARL